MSTPTPSKASYSDSTALGGSRWILNTPPANGKQRPSALGAACGAQQLNQRAQQLNQRAQQLNQEEALSQEVGR